MGALMHVLFWRAGNFDYGNLMICCLDNMPVLRRAQRTAGKIEFCAQHVKKKYFDIDSKVSGLDLTSTSKS